MSSVIRGGVLLLELKIEEIEMEQGTAAVVLDVDGVLIRGNAPVPGAVAALERIVAARCPSLFRFFPLFISQCATNSFFLRLPFVFLTNSSGVPEKTKIEKLQKILNIAEPVLWCNCRKRLLYV